MIKKIFIFSLIFLTAVILWNLFYQPARGLLNKSENETNEILVKLKTSSQIYKIEIKDFCLEKILKILLKRPEIEMAEPNWLVEASAISSPPNDPYYDKLWYLKQIGAEEAWKIVGGGKEEVVVAILDTGVDIDHPDLKENIWTNIDEMPGNAADDDNNGYIDDVHGWDFIENVPDPRPKFKDNWTESGIHHGTLIGGLIAASGNNREGTIGLSYEVRIMPLRVLNNEGTGSVDQVIKGINYAIYNGAKIINLSFVGSEKSYFLKEALKKAWDMGVLVVAAAGNETINAPLDLNKTPVYPICLDADEKENFILGVAATDLQDEKAIFSDYGSSCIDVSAPGIRVFGPLVYQPDKGFNEYYGGYWSGTSLSAPLVSSLAALVWSANPLLSQKDVRDIILGQTKKIDSLNPDFAGQLGQGRIDAYEAVNYALTQKGTLSYDNYIITGAGPGGGPHVRVFDLSGNPKAGFFAYDPKFSGGVIVATGDVDGDGIQEIITGAGPGGGPHVRVFDLSGNPKAGFFAFNESYKGGINIFSGVDIDGDKLDDIIVGVNKLAAPYIRVFEGQFATLRLQFLSYDRLFYQGVKAAGADLNGNKKSEIVVGLGPGREPYVRIFDSEGNFLTKFLAYSPLFKGGVNVATIKVNK